MIKTRTHKDTLIGPSSLPILRGSTYRKVGRSDAMYVWSVAVRDGCVVVSVRPAGESKNIPVSRVPAYVLAEIMRAVSVDA